MLPERSRRQPSYRRRSPDRRRWHPEGVVAAAALKCMGGAIHGRLAPRSDEERDQLVGAGLDPEKMLDRGPRLRQGRVLRGNGDADGSLLRGVRYWPDGATTYSMVMRSARGPSDGSRRSTASRNSKGFPEWTTAGRAASSGTIRVSTILGPRTRGAPWPRERSSSAMCAAASDRDRHDRGGARQLREDLCAAHVTELVAGARRPRPGRPRKMAGETSVAVPKRRGRPRKAAGRKSTGHTRTATRKTTQTSGSPARSAKR